MAQYRIVQYSPSPSDWVLERDGDVPGEWKPLVVFDGKDEASAALAIILARQALREAALPFDWRCLAAHRSRV